MDKAFIIASAIFFHATWTTDSKNDADLAFPFVLAVLCGSAGILLWIWT